jgi:hypothetical protein
MFEHSIMVRKKWIDWNRAGDLCRRRPIRAKVRSGSIASIFGIRVMSAGADNPGSGYVILPAESLGSGAINAS